MCMHKLRNFCALAHSETTLCHTHTVLILKSAHIQSHKYTLVYTLNMYMLSGRDVSCER